MDIMSFFSTNIYFWIIATFALMIVLLGLTILLIVLGRTTHAFKEFKARMSGKPLCLMFTDYGTVEWLTLRPEAGIISTDKYGMHIVNERGTYIDKTTRNIIIPFAAEHASGASVKAYADADKISKVLRDPRQMQQIRMLLASGQLDDVRFEGLRESVNFSQLRGLLNTVLPHNVKSHVNMSVHRQMGSLGAKQGQVFFWYVGAGIGLIVLAGLMLWLTIGNNSGATNVVISAADIAKTTAVNASNVIAG